MQGFDDDTQVFTETEDVRFTTRTFIVVRLTDKNRNMCN